MRVKICGITNVEDAQVSVENSVDALGFIFYEKSKRFIQPGTASKIISSLPFFILKVGVFVNAELKYVNDISKGIGLNAVQLHGDEDAEYISQINLPVIKAVRISNNFDFDSLSKYGNVNFLFDTYDDSDLGGTGKSFNWEIIPKEIRNKVVIAGGVSVDNVEEIYRKIKPAGVDLSSSLETEPGEKDHKKVIQFINIVKKLRKN